LYDSKSIFEDQYEAIKKTSEQKGEEYVNLALLTDGLRAEREQGITIDVAYRYYSTPKRKFIIADTPGHIQYTRNMVTGARTAHLGLVFVDARKGILEQTRRHLFIASLLQIPHVVICINKMDLVGFEQKVFDDIQEQLKEFAARLDIKDVRVIPISALLGDNVVDRSKNMDWYEGPTLLFLLETIHIASDMNHIDSRFPVQYVVRPQMTEHHDYRGYAGRIARSARRRRRLSSQSGQCRARRSRRARGTRVASRGSRFRYAPATEALRRLARHRPEPCRQAPSAKRATREREMS